jgi:hypothetical protein
VELVMMIADLDKMQVSVLIQAINEICNGPEAIDDNEFSVRIGATRQEALQIMQKLQAHLKK